MLTNILTCIGTGSLGVGVGLVINTIRAKSKRKAESISSKEKEIPKKHVRKEENLMVSYGLQSYFDTIDKYINQKDKEEYHAYMSLHKHILRILELNDQSVKDSIKSKYWNPSGAISANGTKVKLWIRTLNHIFTDHIGKNFPEELVDALQFLLDYVNAEQYNKLLDR